MKRKTGMPAPPPPRKELSDNPIKLCNEIGRLFRTRMRETDSSDGVMSQPGARLVLSVLAVYDGIHQLELVRQTHLRPPSVSVILKKMEDEGIVERRSDSEDRRAVRVYLTEKGRCLDAQTIHKIQELDARAMKGLTEEEKAVLMALLPKIRNNLLDDRQGEEEKLQ
ncbi:MAG: MarR family transcriptional regulator [Ruminococcaceae bacterium]|nr:MarR family transcriptional regulator [Oscillospiraceae bacterium]